MCRAEGDLDGALAAVSGALRVDPLGFVPLLLKANLLEKMGRAAEAGETYGYALAQAPAAVPPHLEAMVAHARQRHDAHVAASRRRGSPSAADGAAPRRGGAGAGSRASAPTSCAGPGPIIREPTHFHYPGLREREFHDREPLPLARRRSRRRPPRSPRISTG